MQYEDPLIDEETVGNVNVSSESPLKTFAKLLSALVILLFVSYILLNMLIYQLVQYIPFETEQKYFSSLSKAGLAGLDDKAYAKQTQALQNIADKLRDNAIKADSNHPLKDIQLTLHYSDEELVNAYTLPAGHIVVMRGLLEVMPNENMLAMVIGHEIGHVVHRDSIKRLGRLALSNMVLMSLFGAGDGIMVNQSTSLLENSYSREDESLADEMAVDLLDKTYGHAFGAAELFDVFGIIQPSKSRWIEWSSDHPLPINRRQAVVSLIQQRGYAVLPKKKTPMPVILPHLDCQDCVIKP